jgi:hypothetical protein
MDVEHVSITTNVAGIMRTARDPSVAVWFIRKGHIQCIACDRYQKLEHNLRAIGLTIGNLRAIERYDAALFEDAMSGFSSKALPQFTTEQGWHAVLGISPSATLSDAESAYRDLVKVRHPDVGGNADAFRELQHAIEEARRLLK